MKPFVLLCVFVAAGTVAAQTNLLTNGDFEGGFSGDPSNKGWRYVGKCFIVVGVTIIGALGGAAVGSAPRALGAVPGAIIGGAAAFLISLGCVLII